MPAKPTYRRHLGSSADLETTYEATRAGFVALALEKNHRATPFIAEARALQEAASHAPSPADLLGIKGIENGLLTAAGISDKAVTYLQPEDKITAIKELIRNFLEPAGAKFIEELVFRFLLTRGDSLGGSMRNVGGILAQRKLTRAILSTLKISGTKYIWQDAKSRNWFDGGDDIDIESSLRGLHWQSGRKPRTLIYNLTVPLVRNNIDLCLFNSIPNNLDETNSKSYIALGELKGGIDPAGADEHWKTAKSALDRIRRSFTRAKHSPRTFFVGAAIEKKMASEIWDELREGVLSNAANLNDENQVASISHWLCNL
ncbi:MAG: type II restriction endonuclease [Anaerolineales bacterium]|nr:type II restriction endonuclease [Anaerolineales bacterium]